MAAKFRSFLTILGIVIGIASVIVIMAIGTSAQELILDQVRGIGSNLIGILPGAAEEKGPPVSMMGVAITTLKYEDLEALTDRGKFPHIVGGAAYVTGTEAIQRGSASKVMSYTGTTASYIEIEDTGVARGRFFNKEEEKSMARVAVLGSQTSEEFFGKGANPIGERIKIGKENFTVIGVLEERGAAVFTNQDIAVFIPLFTAQKILLGIDHLNFVRLKVDSEENIEKTVASVKAELRKRHDIDDPSDDDFTVRDQKTGLEMIGNITNILKYFLAAIAAISLAVGGVGIMNTMLISVNQRIREVGLRKALGAKNSTIMLQFLVESVFITLIGGVLGILFGVLVSLAAAAIIQYLGYHWPFIVTPFSVALAALISAAVGIIFGIYPARKAAKLNVVEALRYE